VESMKEAIGMALQKKDEWSWDLEDSLVRDGDVKKGCAERRVHLGTREKFDVAGVSEG
jgi:hypothetical protein